MEPCRVTTNLGAIEGARSGSVRSFRGIRYATAGRLRPPVAVGGWTGVLDATAAGPAAAQPRGGPHLVPGLEPEGPLAEDCLTVDVWTPVGADALPVLVWIHGGSFLIGAASSPTCDGARLAAGGAVVVSVQYRLGAFGFVDLRAFGGDDAGMVANAGLHDVVAALTWVRDHIGAFGGDPARVTAMGESAGGGVILHLLGTPSGDGAGDRGFDRAIVQSGSTGRTFDAATAATIAERLLAAVGVADAAAYAVAPLEDLVAASVAVQRDPVVFAAAGLMPFHPSVDGVLVSDPPDSALARGAGRGCDLVLGVTRDEMQLFLADVEIEPGRLQRRVEKYLGLSADAAADRCDSYRRRLESDGLRSRPIDVWGAIYSDREMLLPARAALDAQATFHAATFGYRFDWSAPDRADGRPVGAAHGVDIPFTFGNFDPEWLDFLGGADDRRPLDALSDEMRAAWIAFAAVGTPTSPRIGAWPRWEAPTRTAAVLGASPHVATDPIGVRGALLA